MVIETTELTWRDQVELEASVRASRKDIRSIIQVRFGRVSPAVEAALEGMQSEDALDVFLRRAAIAPTEDDLLQE